MSASGADYRRGRLTIQERSAMIVLLQIAVILAIARAMSAVFRPLRQPAVVAEMVSGFLLGPSFFGWLAPG
jgi:Kef-type K+ transport system membrane component KefB